jgi:primosomal protein N' (replication factor Y)
VLTGPPDAVEAAVAELRLPPGTELLGPVPQPAAAQPRVGGSAGADHTDPPVRMVVRVPRRWGTELSRGLVQLQGVRSARKLPAVRVQVDPHTLG